MVLVAPINFMVDGTGTPNNPRKYKNTSVFTSILNKCVEKNFNLYEEIGLL